jgi:subtilisin family serine protease
MRRTIEITVLCALVTLMGACGTCQQQKKSDSDDYQEAADRIPGFDDFRAMYTGRANAKMGPESVDEDLRIRLNGKPVPVTIFDNVIAVRGPRSVIQPGDVFMSGVNGDVEAVNVGMKQMRRHNLSFVGIAETPPDDLDDLIQNPPSGVTIGRVVFLGESAGDVFDAPSAVMLPQVVVRVRPDVIAGQDLVALKPTIDAQLKDLNLVFQPRRRFGDSMFILRSTSTDPRNWIHAANQLLLRSDIVDGLAHPDFIVPKTSRAQEGIYDSDLEEAEDPPPLDTPQFEDQWHLYNTGQLGGTPQADIRVIGGWSSFGTGSPDVIIAILDLTYGDVGHPALAPALFRPPLEGEELTDVEAARWSEMEPGTGGHGTAVAGVAVARATDDSTVSGVAPGCRFIGYDIGALGEAELSEAMEDAHALGCRVFNMSWDYTPATPAETVANTLATLTTLTSDDMETGGVVAVAAVTNHNIDNFVGPVDRLVEHSGVMAVGRSTDMDEWGRCGYGAGMSVVAPSGRERGHPDAECELEDDYDGEDDGEEVEEDEPAIGVRQITTIDLRGVWGFNTGHPLLSAPVDCNCASELQDTRDLSYTRCFRGTSAAAPQVAALAALVLSVNPELTPSEVRTLIEENARKIAVPPEFGGGSETDPMGAVPNGAIGHGVIDVYRTLKYASGSISP